MLERFSCLFFILIETHLIPQILHQIWLGQKPPSDILLACRERVLALHPDWNSYFWTSESIYNDPMFSQFELNKNIRNLMNRYDVRADILRYAVLAKYGGVYLDMDIYCIRPLNCLLQRNFLYGEHGTIANPEPTSGTGRKANGVLGSQPGSKIMFSLLQQFSVLRKIGIHAFGDAINKTNPSPVPISWKVLYPHYWTQKEHQYRIYPETLTIHCWRKLKYDLKKLERLAENANIGTADSVLQDEHGRSVHS